MSEENPYAPPSTPPQSSSPDPTGAPTQLASRGARLAGALIDTIIAVTVVLAITFVFGGWERLTADRPLTLSEHIGQTALGFCIFLTLHGYLLAHAGQTIGKRVVGTRIVSVNDGDLLPLWHLFALRYVPIAIASSIPAVGIVISLFDVLLIFGPERRCLHDYIAGTKVVNALN